MERYSSKASKKEGFTVIELRDSETDSVVEVVPEIGNNIFRFESQGKSIILEPDHLQGLKEETFKYGTPILYPPNRIKGGRFEYNERAYQLPLNEPTNHLHGEICSKPWVVVEYGTTDELGAFLISTFRYQDHPEILSYFPHALTFTVTVSLYDGELQMNTRIVNESDDEAPFAYGLHPYFRLPFHKQEKMTLKVPAAVEWPVTNEAFVTGLPSTTTFCKQLLSGIDLLNYPKLGCSLLTLADGDSVCELNVESQGYTILYKLDQQFPFIVLFRPDWASAFSLEPYTYVTDAFNLPYEKEMTGARGIHAGETIELNTSLKVKM